MKYESYGNNMPEVQTREKKSFGRQAILSFVALSALLLVVWSSEWSPSSTTGTRSSFKAKSSSKKQMSEEEECSECPSPIENCVNANYAVLGGIDVVATYNLYDSSVTKQAEGVAGSSEYSAVYNGFTFYFSNADNKAVFEANPSQYEPQWGGFCSWGMSAEYCPEYPWSSTCLGPSGNWQYWTLVDGKLHFFLKESPMTKFLANTTYYTKLGNERWASWFGTSTVLNTLCYLDTLSEKKGEYGPAVPVDQSKKVTVVDPVTPVIDDKQSKDNRPTESPVVDPMDPNMPMDDNKKAASKTSGPVKPVDTSSSK